MGAISADLECWIKSLMVKKGVLSYQIDVSGSSSKGDGYLGEVNFIKVIAKPEKGKEKHYYLVVKSAKKSDEFRKHTPLREAFEREIFVYTKVFPIFMEFQAECAVEKPFTKFPKCYSACSENKREAIIMKNLKAIGFEVHDRRTPQNLNHALYVFQNYARFHATSLALRRKKPAFFKSLTKNMTDVLGEFLILGKMIPNLKDDVRVVINALKDAGKEEIAKKYDGFEDNIEEYLTNYTEPNDAQSVILHGDCWNNNMMFKYEKIRLNIECRPTTGTVTPVCIVVRQRFAGEAPGQRLQVVPGIGEII